MDEVCIRDLSLNGSGDGPDDKDGEGGGQSNGGRDRAAATAVIAEAETPDAYVAGLNASGKARISQHCFTEEALDTAVHFQVRHVIFDDVCDSNVFSVNVVCMIDVHSRWTRGPKKCARRRADRKNQFSRSFLIQSLK